MSGQPVSIVIHIDPPRCPGCRREQSTASLCPACLTAIYYGGPGRPGAGGAARVRR